MTNLFLRYDYQSGQKNDLENISFVCAATFESGTNPSLSKRLSARFNGTVMLHPSEDYWGHVNPIGPRACYDEGKRVAETLAYAYAKQSGSYLNDKDVFLFYPQLRAC